MCSSRSIANETLGSQVHFPWLPFLPGLWRRLHWAHLATRVDWDQNLIQKSEALWSKRLKYLCPSFALLLLQYNDSILRIAFACGNMMNNEHRIEVLNIWHRIGSQKHFMQIIHVQNTSLYFLHPCKILHMWHLPVQGSYTPGCPCTKYTHVPICTAGMYKICTASTHLFGRCPCCTAAPSVLLVLLPPPPPDHKQCSPQSNRFHYSLQTIKMTCSNSNCHQRIQ